MKHLSLALTLVSLASPLSAHYSNSSYYRSYSSYPSNMQHHMEAMALDPNLYRSDFFIEQVIRYLDNCRFSADRTPILLALAHNPGLAYSRKLTHYLVHYLANCFFDEKTQIFTALMRNPSMPESDTLVAEVCRFVDQVSFSQRQTLIVDLAYHPALGKSNRLVQTVTHHLNQCWGDNNKLEVLHALGSNPSVHNNYSCAHLFQEEARRHQDNQEFVTTFLAGVAVGTVVWNLLFTEKEPTYTRTTYSTTYYR